MLRLLPLGDHPPFRQEVRDGVRYELDPPEGSVPPGMIDVANGGTAADAEEKLPPFRLRLGSPSPERTVMVDETRSVGLLHPNGERWASLRVSKGPRSLVVAWREPGKKWNEPRFLALDDGPQNVPPGTVRFLNVSRMTVGLQWGEAKVALRPGRVFELAFPEQSGRVALMILYPEGGDTFRQAFASIVEPDRSKRHQFFIHDSDGEGSRAPVRVVPLIEERSLPQAPAAAPGR